MRDDDDDLPIVKPILLQTVIRNAILNALAYTDGRQDRAGALLGIGGSTVNWLMQRHHIPRPKDGRHGVAQPTPRDRALAKLTAADRRALGLE